MTVADHMPDQRSSCQWRLLRLRTLVQSEDGLVLPRSIIAEVRDTTNAVITEVEAATRAVLETGSRGPGAETFLWVRVTRLKVAADQAINAARDGNVPELLAHLRHFDTLTTAIWTVQQAVYGQEPAHVALSLNQHLGGGSRHDRARADRGRRSGQDSPQNPPRTTRRREATGQTSADGAQAPATRLDTPSRRSPCPVPAPPITWAHGRRGRGQCYAGSTWVAMPRWVSVAGYLGLGWFAAFVLPQLAAGTGIGALLLIVAGGGLPAKTLLEAATGADMLVVGSRGAGGFQRLRLGSVSTQVTHHAPCPVVVITAGDA